MKAMILHFILSFSGSKPPLMPRKAVKFYLSINLTFIGSLALHLTVSN